MKNGNQEQEKDIQYEPLLYAVLNWFRRTFVKIDITEAKERGFSFVGNVHGDEINQLNCRSIWRDKKGKAWRVKQLG